MAWCSKIYEMFNGWGDEDQPYAIESSLATFKPNNLPINTVAESPNTLIQHDSPFLEKSDSVAQSDDRRESLFNADYALDRDYYGEYFCADTFFSCHQRDGPTLHKFNERSYGIATISNMSLNLVPSMGNTKDKYQQQLTRSFSFDAPMECRRGEFSKASIDDRPTRVRYSSNKSQNHRQSSSSIRSELMGGRISTRSLYDSQDLSHQNNERKIKFQIQQMFQDDPHGIFPMIYRSATQENDQYRIEGGYGEASSIQLQPKIYREFCRIETEDVAKLYIDSFVDQYHTNHYAVDQDSNPIIMSVKPHQSQLSIIVRTKDGSKSTNYIENDGQITDCVQLSKLLFPNLQIDHFETCSWQKSQSFVREFDEKLEIRKFKFAVIYQRRGQTTEEEFFNNQDPQPAFTDFLRTIATEISLKNFQGYRAGLDVSEQTDSPYSYYEVFENKEIMFHVSTMLPFNANDPLQIQRKRHIGNDIVGIIFQEENTPFHPCMIKSSFLHVFLVVQPAKVLSRSFYKIMVVAREDIPDFSPTLLPNVGYIRTAENLKPFILSKLINAEYAAYRCRTFSLLQERTRCTFLKNLCENLSEKSYENLCDDLKRSAHRRSSLIFNSNRKNYLSSVKKIFTRSSTLPEENRQSIKSDSGKSRFSKKFLRTSKSTGADASRRSSSTYDLSRDSDSAVRNRTDSSNSTEDQRSSTIQNDFSGSASRFGGDDSDEGLDSMSSADNTRVPYDSDDQDAYRRQIREKSQPNHLWHNLANQRHINTPPTPGIHLTEASTV